MIRETLIKIGKALSSSLPIDIIRKLFVGIVRKILMLVKTYTLKKEVNRKIRNGSKIYIHPIVFFKVILRLFSEPLFPLDNVLKLGEHGFGKKLNQLIKDKIKRGNPDYFEFKDFKIYVPNFKNAEQVILNDFREIYLENVYTKHFFMGKPIKRGDIILDLGANIGGFSLWAANQAKDVKVFAVEPHPKIFKELNLNIALNKLEDSITSIEICIAEEDGFKKINFDEETFTMTRISTHKDAQEIESMSIDSLVDKMKLPNLDLIKFDIEGAERIAILGAKATLINLKPKLALSGYHLVDDVYFLINQILEIQPEYKIIVGSNMHIYAF